MLEILQFIFSSFWVWLGSFLMLALIAGAIASMRLVVINPKEDDDSKWKQLWKKSNKHPSS